MKVRKGVAYLLYIVILSLFLLVPSFAEANRVTDEGNLLSSEEEEKLQEIIDELSERLQVDIGIVTTEDAQGKSAKEYLKDFRDAGVFGRQISENYLTDILFLIDMDNREAYILSDMENGVYFSDDIIELMLEEIYKGLEKEDFYQSSTIFLEQVEIYGTVGEERRVFDQYDLLSISEEASLQREIDKMSKKTGIDIVIVTTGHAEGKTSKSYAEDFYNSGNFGSSYSQVFTSGILFLMDKDNDNIYISIDTANEERFTNQNINDMLDSIKKYTNKDDFYGASKEFVKRVRRYGGVGEPMSLGTRIISALLIAVGFATVVVGIMTASTKTRKKPIIMAYIKDQRVEIRQREDRFINTTVSTRRIPRTPPPSSGGSSGGGRSMGGSSGGSRSSGGGGRKF